MAFAGNIKPGVQDGCGSQRQRDGAAQAQTADVAAAPYDDPARAGGKRADPQRGAHGIDDKQDEDDPEASKRRAGEVGRIEPSSAIGQAGQQQRDADAAFGKRRSRSATVASASATITYSPGTTSGTHRKAIMAATPLIANHDACHANSTRTRSGA